METFVRLQKPFQNYFLPPFTLKAILSKNKYTHKHCSQEVTETCKKLKGEFLSKENSAQ
jgi:hypothetical protein